MVLPWVWCAVCNDAAKRNLQSTRYLRHWVLLLWVSVKDKPLQRAGTLAACTSVPQTKLARQVLPLHALVTGESSVCSSEVSYSEAQCAVLRRAGEAGDCRWGGRGASGVGRERAGGRHLQRRRAQPHAQELQALPAVRCPSLLSLDLEPAPHLPTRQA